MHFVQRQRLRIILNRMPWLYNFQMVMLFLHLNTVFKQSLPVGDMESMEHISNVHTLYMMDFPNNPHCFLCYTTTTIWFYTFWRPAPVAFVFVLHSYTVFLACVVPSLSQDVWNTDIFHYFCSFWLVSVLGQFLWDKGFKLGIIG